MDGLVDRLHPALPGSELGEVFDQLVYLTDDNGTDLIKVCRQWLDGDDVRKVEAALSVSVVFLFDSKEKLEDHYLPLAARWPQLSGRVTEILKAWDKQHEPQR